MKRFLCLLILCLPLITHAQEEKGIQWTTGLSWQQIKQKAKAENKYIFVDAYATWCGPCKDMDKKIYINDSVGDYFNQHFISVKVQMDKTKKDDEQVKNWYDDATAIAKQYDIQSFPSFLFLNPQGVITDLQTGYKNVNEFVAIAKSAKQPGKVYNSTLDMYNSLVAEYRKGTIAYQYLPMMIDFATRLDTALRAELMKDHKEYVIALPAKDRYTKENIKFWSSLQLDLSSPFFQFFLDDGERIDKIMGYKGYATDIIDKTIQVQIVTPFLVEQNTRKEIPMSGLYAGGIQPDNTEADWKKLQQLISKQFNNKIAARNVLAAKIEWYARHLNYYMFCKYKLIQLNKYKPNLMIRNGTTDVINAAAFNAFLKFTDKKMLNGYVKWMAKVVEARPGVSSWMDTYANLLYKLGRKDEAILWEEKALQVGDRYEEIYKTTLGQMKRGEPTNGVQPLVEYKKAF